MQRAFEKIIERLKCKAMEHFDEDLGEIIKRDDVINIVNQVASEYGGGWIPVSSEKLPKVPEGKDYVDVLITKQYTSSAEVIFTEYYEEDGFNDYEKSLITAWRYDNTPEPYKAESEE